VAIKAGEKNQIRRASFTTAALGEDVAWDEAAESIWAPGYLMEWVSVSQWVLV